VTVRGKRAEVSKGRFHVTLRLRPGVNRFTVVVRHRDRLTRRRPVRVDRQAPPPPPPPVSAPAKSKVEVSSVDGADIRFDIQVDDVVTE